MSNSYAYADEATDYPGSQYAAASPKASFGNNSPSYQEKMLAQARYRAKLEHDKHLEPVQNRRTFQRREIEEPDVGLAIGKNVSKEDARRAKKDAQEEYRNMIAEAQSRPAVSSERRAIQRPNRQEDDDNCFNIGRQEDRGQHSARQREHNARVQDDMAEKQERLRRLAAAEKETFSGLLIGRQAETDKKKKKYSSAATRDSDIFAVDMPEENLRETNRARMQSVEQAVDSSGLVRSHAKAPKKEMPPFVYAEEPRRPQQQSARRDPYDNNKPFMIGSENRPGNSAKDKKDRQLEYRLALSRDIEEKDDVKTRNDYMYSRREL